jgi:hypothetical protein
MQDRLLSVLGFLGETAADQIYDQATNDPCTQEDCHRKDRLLNPTSTLAALLLQVLEQNTPLNDVPRRRHESFAGSALCKARRRVFLEGGVGVSLGERFLGPSQDPNEWTCPT